MLANADDANLGGNGGEDKIIADLTIRDYLQDLKVNMFIQKLEKLGVQEIEKNAPMTQLTKYLARQAKKG